MPNYPDLGTMYKNGMGGMASYYAGQNQNMAMQQDQATLQRQQLENQQAQTMNPLNAQFKQGEIDQQQAQLPGMVGVSQQQAAAGQVAQGSVPLALAAKISEYQSQIGKNGFDQMDQVADKLSKVTAMVKAANLPVMAQPSAIAAALQKYGVDPNDSMVAPLLKTSPDKILTSIDQGAQGYALASEQYRKESKLAQDHAASEEKIHAASNAALIQGHQISAGATVSAAKIAADSRILASENRAKAAASHANIEQRIGVITSDPNWKQNPAKVQQYNDLMSSAEPLRNAAANGYQTAEMLGQQTPHQRFDPVKVSGSSGGPPEDAATLDKIKKAAGASYNPDKFDYRINPQTGVVESKPKG